MKDEQFEAILRAAKPDANDIAPLSPETSTRILHAALRANRRSQGGMWIGMPWRVAMGAVSFGAVAFFLMPQTLVSEQDAYQSEAVVVATPTFVKNTQQPVPEATATPKPGKKAAPAPVKNDVKRRMPSILPKQLTPHKMIAKHRAPHHSAKLSKPAKNAIIPKTQPEMIAQVAPAEEEPSMLVSVSGASSLPPIEEIGETLLVSVTNDVPDSIPGTAEAASLQAVVVPQTENDGTLSPDSAQAVPVWAYARVESGEDAEVTLTEIR